MVHATPYVWWGTHATTLCMYKSPLHQSRWSELGRSEKLRPAEVRGVRELGMRGLGVRGGAI